MVVAVAMAAVVVAVVAVVAVATAAAARGGGKVHRPGVVKMPDGREITWENGGKGSLFLDSKKPGAEIVEGKTLYCSIWFCVVLYTRLYVYHTMRFNTSG